MLDREGALTRHDVPGACLMGNGNEPAEFGAEGGT